MGWLRTLLGRGQPPLPTPSPTPINPVAEARRQRAAIARAAYLAKEDRRFAHARPGLEKLQAELRMREAFERECL